MYLKWLGMVMKVSDHVDPVEIEKQACNIKIAGTSQEEDEVEEEDIEIPEVPLELDDS